MKDSVDIRVIDRIRDQVRRQVSWQVRWQVHDQVFDQVTGHQVYGLANRKVWEEINR
jgi:hypothetical protein